MNLFFLRHAKACPRGPKYRPDSKRPLTREGERTLREVARGIQRQDLAFDLILASPYLRALRTAEILAEAFDSKKLFVTNHLAADADPRQVVAEINENFATLENIVLVGHEPFLSGLISILLSGEPGMKIDFKKAALCKLSVEDLRFGDCASLCWLLTPRQLARLGKRGRK
ncbi:MAG: phosphohistidine phosphatase SixA [Verrucomicrobiota bacterium]|jgi:phosphohistidine phosphatase